MSTCSYVHPNILREFSVPICSLMAYYNTAIHAAETYLKIRVKFLMSVNIYQHIIRKLCMIGNINVLPTYRNMQGMKGS